MLPVKGTRWRPEARWTLVAWFVILGLLGGCRGAPPSPEMPAGFDLSGTWVLSPGESETPPPTHVLRARGGMLNLVVQDFPVLRAQRMIIEQDGESMGMSYDGRDYRDVSWGTRKRGLWEVQAGWIDGQLVILSKADDADATETFRLSPDGSRLAVRVEIRSGGERVGLTRTFTRA